MKTTRSAWLCACLAAVLTVVISGATAQEVRVRMADGSVVTAKSVKPVNGELELDMGQGGKAWIPKNELSPEARHQYFGDPLHELPKPEPKKPEPFTKTEAPTKSADSKANAESKEFEPPKELLTEEPPQSATVEEIKIWLQKYLEAKDGQKIKVTSIPKGSDDGYEFWYEYGVAPAGPTHKYRLIGEHLLIVDDWLKKNDLKQQRYALAAAVRAVHCATRKLGDKTLAVAICDAYLRPNLGIANPDPLTTYSKRFVIEQIIHVYVEAQKDEKAIEAYKLLLDAAPNQNTADFARQRLSEFYDKQGNYGESIRYLKEMSPDNPARELIPRIEKKLKDKNAEQKGKPE